MTRSAADLVIVGSGPAGLAAGVEAARLGLSVVLLDENRAPGGRIWQALEARGASDADEAAGLNLMRAFAASAVDARFGAGVWGIEDGTVFWSADGVSGTIRTRHVLLATGTTERPMPVPGWTLPGVMTVGAAQVALKTGGLVPDGKTWIAGQGPLTVLYAVQAIRAGGRIAGILDLSDPAARWRALRHLPGAIGDVRKGLRWIRELRRAGVPVVRAGGVRAEGDGALCRVVFQADGVERREDADLLLLHDGVVPSIQITRALGCAHVWDDAQRCWRPKTDAWGATSVPGIAVAGDGAGVGGANSAVPAGRIAALGCAHALGFIDTERRDREAAPFRAAHRHAVASRPFIDALFAPRPIDPDDAVLICRCEEVAAGDIRAAARRGCPGLNQLKAYTRCGMGPCQGRMCGPAAADVLAAAHGLRSSAVEPFRTRFPARPLTVGELAALDR